MDNCYFTIGREGQICLRDQTVSKQHAEIQVKNGEIYLKDLNSTNGTFLVKNNRLVPFHEGYVQPNQIIALGNIRTSVEKLLGMAGAGDWSTQDGTTKLGHGSRPLHISHPRQKFFHANWA